MTPNVGTVDRALRLLAGILLIAFALHLILPGSGWNALGWIGVVPIVTALFRFCPAYTVFGASTCGRG